MIKGDRNQKREARMGGKEADRSTDGAWERPLSLLSVTSCEPKAKEVSG